MQYFLIILLIIVIAGGIARFIFSGARSEYGLKRKYVKLSSQPPHVARQTLQMQLERLKKRYPQKSRKWRLEKIIYDLQKDR